MKHVKFVNNVVEMTVVYKYALVIFCMQFLFPVVAKLQETELDGGSDYVEEEVLARRYSFLSLDFDWNIPVDGQRQLLKRNIPGFGVRYLYQIRPEKPFFAGVSLSYGSYDQSFLEYYDFSEIDEFLFRETAYCSVFNVNLDLRYFPGLGFWIFEPFFGTSIGMSNSFLYSSIYNVDLAESHGTSLNTHSWNPVYLFEGGTLIRLAKDFEEVFGHVTVGYFSGVNNFFHLKKTDFNPADKPFRHFESKKMPVQMLKMNFGIIAYF